MHWYHFALIGSAIIAGLMAGKTPRAWLWIAAMAASFAVSVTYLYLPGPWWLPQPGIAMMCDAVVFLAVREMGRDRWEIYGLGTLLMISVTLSLMQTAARIAGFPPQLPSEVYAIALEIINYLALILIGGVGLLDRIEASDVRLHFPRPARSAMDTIGNFAHRQTNQKTPFQNW